MARFTVGFVFVVMFLNLLAVRDCGAEPTSKPADDAWPLYSKAAERVEEGYRAKIMSPTASNLDYQNFPPFPPEWYKYEKEAYAFNAPARALLREARSRSVAHWPVTGEGVDAKLPYLPRCRTLANEVADAAIYEHLQGNDAAAIETVRDELHLAELLDARPSQWMVVSLVAVGIQMSALTRLEVITAEVSLTEDATDSKRLQVRVARELIRQLMDAGDPVKQYGELLERETALGLNAQQKERFLTTIRKAQMERHLAGMSLACHLFVREKSRWPASVAELVAYLPAEPVDAWGKMGYAFVKLPSGADRPMVYSRCYSKDGLFYLTEGPVFGYYRGDGSSLPLKEQKEGGQFRDVTVWAVPAVKPSPTTRALKE